MLPVEMPHTQCGAPELCGTHDRKGAQAPQSQPRNATPAPLRASTQPVGGSHALWGGQAWRPKRRAEGGLCWRPPSRRRLLRAARRRVARRCAIGRRKRARRALRRWIRAGAPLLHGRVRRPVLRWRPAVVRWSASQRLHTPPSVHLRPWCPARRRWAPKGRHARPSSGWHLRHRRARVELQIEVAHVGLESGAG
jgi:hypothetical protein